MAAKTRKKEDKAVAKAAPSLNTVATFEVVEPFCGLDAGSRRTVKVSREILTTADKGIIKFI